MKTKYITLTFALLLSLYIPTQAQSNEGGFWDGIEGTLGNMFDDAIQGTEAGRLFMLFNSDISMIMKAHQDMEVKQISKPLFVFETISYPSDASMTAEFDWDNKALSMHLKKSATDEKVSWGAPIVGMGKYKKTNEAIDQYQYTDKDGYWYVPYNNPNWVGTGERFYVKFNAKKSLLELSELELDSLTRELISEIIAVNSVILFNILQPELANIDGNTETMLRWIDFGANGAYQNAESHRSELRNLLNSRYLSIVGFPVFIHWAFLYSPDYIRARFNVTETTVNYFDYVENLPASYTKLTVTSGKEKGKYMVFDQYNRLVFIDSKKDGSVQFFYGRDLTVTLPAARTMSDVMNDAMEQSNRRN